MRIEPDVQSVESMQCWLTVLPPCRDSSTTRHGRTEFVDAFFLTADTGEWN